MLLVTLQDENTRVFVVVWIVFNDHRTLDAGDYFSHKNTICGQFIIAMFRYADIALSDQRQNQFKCLAHVSFPQIVTCAAEVKFVSL